MVNFMYIILMNAQGRQIRDTLFIQVKKIK